MPILPVVQFHFIGGAIVLADGSNFQLSKIMVRKLSDKFCRGCVWSKIMKLQEMQSKMIFFLGIQNGDQGPFYE